MKTFLQTLFFFLLVTQFCFAQWYEQNSGTSANLNAVQFTDANNGLVVGDSGIILHTTNGGQEWLAQTSGTTHTLYDVSFADVNNGWAVGDSGTIIKTTDGGINWTQQTSGTVGQLNGIYFVDANNGWAVGENFVDSSFSLHAIILHTTNGGVNWIQQFNAVVYDNWGRPLGGLKDVCFIDTNTGTAVGGIEGIWHLGFILRTTDGGTTWVQQHTGTDNKTPSLKGVTFTNTVTGFVVGYSGVEIPTDGEIWHTIDGGSTWSLDSTKILEYGRFSDVFFPDFDNGTVVGYIWEYQEGVILHTINAGANWIKQTSGTMNSLNGVFFTDALAGWVVGDNGTILHTTNGGVTFIEEEQIDEVPTEFLLSQNYPNPFNSSSVIKYSIPKSSQVTIKIFNTLGEEIETLVNDEKLIGTYEVNWNAASATGGLPSGVYFYRLQAGDFVQTRKMILLK